MKKWNMKLFFWLGVFAIAVTYLCCLLSRIEVNAAENNERTEIITGYCSCSECCGSWSDGLTYSETPVHVGICASSNAEYFGKTILVYDNEGSLYGIYECTDKGPEHIDIYFDTHEEALEFGIHNWEIEVVDAMG